MLLTELAVSYRRKRLAGCEESTEGKFRWAIGWLEKYLKRPPEISDLTEDVVIHWAWWMTRKGGLSVDSAAMYHGKMLALWRFGCRQGLVAVWPEHGKMPVPKRIPVAWSTEQLAKLWAECDRQQGWIGLVPARHWWHSLHACLWDTGERICAMLSTEWADVDLNSGWLVCRAETRKGKLADKSWRLHPDTIRLLRLASDPPRRLVWPFPYSNGTLWNRYRKLLCDAGLPHDRKHKFHCLRKSAASYFEAAGGDATQLLGHSSRAVTLAYLDPRIVQPKQASDLLFRPGEPQAQ